MRFTFILIIIVLLIISITNMYVTVEGPSLAYIIFPLSVWAFISLVIAYLEKKAFSYVKSNFKRKSISLSLLLYLPVHLIIYSLAIEKLLSFIFGYQGIFSSAQVLFTYTPFPPTLTGFILTVLFDPSLDLFIPPVYYLSLTPFSIITAVIISFIVSANIGKIIELVKSKLKVIRQIGVVLSLGLIAGSTCCLSLPSLIALYTPFLSNLAYNTKTGETILALYFLLPLITIVVLSDQFRRVIELDKVVNK
ncbi:hypothetical protein [Stygiolobus caldivivus]|uniref:Uncharacterized protein n=1 Tax=Stygiolobus caldivivus TaxID=2824673 RepID=A0A8D5U685_9CREN|nr:hypothetical protein [Stygiolobus caldivivus]BCU69606.1 hypothetical protein KN1_09030 [Stygiolobus caldivivus]